MMDTVPIKRKKPHRRSKNSSSMVFLPEELLAEILPFFNVKTILQLKCLSKSWLAFISDSNFVQKHLKKSSQNPCLTLCCYNQPNHFDVVPYPVYRILKNPSIDLSNSPNIESISHWSLVGSCNGLLCLKRGSITNRHVLRLWNPSTRNNNGEFGFLPWSNPYNNFGSFDFTFGYDASRRDYKIVAFRAKEIEGSWKSEVKVFSLGDNCWRNIESFPLVPFHRFEKYKECLIDGVHFSGTVNWLSVNMSIISLYLSTETYKQFLLPPGFDAVPFSQPVLRVLMDCLCFSYDSKKTEFVLWQMKQYGVHESWTQLFKISYQNLQMHNIYGSFQLACLYVNGDMVIFANKSTQYSSQAYIYNLKDKTIEGIKCSNPIQWFDNAKDYVESLVSVGLDLEEEEEEDATDTNEDLEDPANTEAVVMSPQVKEKRKVVLPSHLKDFAMPTWKKGSRK